MICPFFVFGGIARQMSNPGKNCIDSRGVEMTHFCDHTRFHREIWVSEVFLWCLYHWNSTL